LGKTLTLVFLTSGENNEGTVTIKHTSLVAKQASWKDGMFIDARSFLAQTHGEPGNLFKVTVPEDPLAPLSTELFCCFPGVLLDGYNEPPPFVRAIFKPAVESESVAFIICGVKRLTCDYRLVFFPTPKVVGNSIPNYFLGLSKGVLGRWVLSRDKKKVYVIAATQLSLADFLAGVDAPQVRAFDQADKDIHEAPAQTSWGHLVVYEVSFNDSTPVVRPRFYLGPRYNLNKDGEQEEMGEWYSKVSLVDVWRASCSINTHFLSIKVDDRNMAICFFVASADSVPTYHRVETENFKCFACSENGTYTVFFPAWFSHWSDIRGNRECTNYNNLNPDATNIVELDLHARLITALVL
jgi:hypothetical protein